MGRRYTSTDGFGMGSQELEELTDNLMEILGRARYSQKYRPIRDNNLGTPGRELLAWLRGLCPVELKNGEIKETKLYATAGIYTLEHDPQLSIHTTEMAIVASFEDLIKVYSRVATSGGIGEIDIEWYEEVATGPEEVAKGNYAHFEKKRGRIDRNWYDLGLRIQQRVGNFELRNSGRPIFYEYIVGDDFGTGRLVKELSGTGFPSYIGGSNPGILCSIRPVEGVD